MLSLQDVEDPVAEIEQQECHGENHPRVLVDDVDVLDFRHGVPDHGRSALYGVQHLWTVAVAGRPVSKTRSRRRPVAACYPKTRRKFG